MAFKSGDKQSANFRDEISQVAQRQMIISIFQAWDDGRNPSRSLALERKLWTSLRASRLRSE